VFAFAPGPRHACSDTFLNDGAFKLGKHAHHLKHSLACGRGRINALLMQIQVDTERMDFGKKGDKVLQAAAQPID
jgi:hypothetical protein